MEKYFHEAFDNMKRLGPGSKASTIQAAGSYKGKAKKFKILDIGCGKGIHTLQLASFFPEAEIIAIDSHMPNIEWAEKEINKHNLSDRIKVICCTMFDMPFEEKEFDLIWSEGAIYIAGFANGLRDWKHYLKDAGYLICSEISWITDRPSKESRTFWEANYPQMASIEQKVSTIEESGFSFVSSFICPEEDWTDEYYVPLEKNLRAMEEKYEHHDDALTVIKMLRDEIQLYERCKKDYSYVFYTMIKS